MKLLGIFHFPNYADPAAALVCDGRVVAFAEEERLVRNKHALSYFPSRSIKYVLEEAKLSIDDIDAITTGWDCEAHEDGRLAAHFEEINALYPPPPHDVAYQKNRLQSLTATNHRGHLIKNLRKMFGDREFPPFRFMDHHLAHAVMAYFHSGIDEALVLTIDGSGEWITTAWWHGHDGKLDLLHEIKTPHSLGWFYSAFTEYLGFDAYDGEYKVMGLAAYGEPAPELAEKLKEIVWYDGNGGFLSDPNLLSMGPRSYSRYYPDTLIEFMGRPPRSQNEEIDDWHVSLAYEVQRRLESIVQEMTGYWVNKTELRKLCIAGGVGLNVKMNGNLFASEMVEDLFVHPLSSDTGMAVGSGMALEYLNGTLRPETLEDVSFGPSYSDAEVERILKACKLCYSYEESIEQSVARLLADGKVVGWFQGRMEAGPRALGNRSILADPRHVESRDRVNAVIKFREFWRPFCPSMTAEAADEYLTCRTHAPFMIVTFGATQAAAEEIPAVVHVDKTSRVQVVSEDVNPRYYRLLEEFKALTGVAVVLNTSFNIKGEPIVCSPHDAIRTFSATGLDALAIGPFLLLKPNQTAGEPELESTLHLGVS